MAVYEEGTIADGPNGPIIMKNGRWVPSVSNSESIGRGAVAGLTFEFDDEIWAGLKTGFGYAGDYEKERDRLRAAKDRAFEANPLAYMGGSVAGSLPTFLIPGLGVAKGTQAATLLGRVGHASKAGLLGGTLYGAGTSKGDITTAEGLADRARSASAGGIVGGLLGPASELAATGLHAAGSKIIQPIRGWSSAGREAAKRVAAARALDDTISQRRLPPTTIDDPVINIDRGGEATRALGKSASNQSPEARATLLSVMEPRAEQQGQRVIEKVRSLVGGNTSFDNRIILRENANKINAPAYNKAFAAAQGKNFWDDTLQQLAGAPTVQNAMRQAAVTSRNASALRGQGSMTSPFIANKATGQLDLKPDSFPTLEFWDQVKRNLDKMNSGEARQFASVLREHLDTIVPEYKDARAGAAKLFGEEDALTAGEKFFNSRMGNEEGQALISKMKQKNPYEYKLFREGYADALINKVHSNNDNRNVVISSYFNSPAGRQRTEIALGKDVANKIETALRIESYFQRSFDAVRGGSPTAQYLTELGLAGGATAGSVGYGMYTGNYTTAAIGLGAVLASRGRSRIEKSVAREVGELLASQNPVDIQRGIQMIARSKTLMDALRTLTGGVAIGVGQKDIRSDGNMTSEIKSHLPLEITVPIGDKVMGR